MPHITFYRKYRSQNFSEIIGQDHIVQTLQNAIKYNRLTHAYIFSGPRGTGKTSIARIFAKTLNCIAEENNKPCLTCHICQKITAGTAVDVIEIDAASNTGVDNIRSLNDQVNFTPVECKYKIYIIDEVHMLSIGAFNALLKTLEEPPQNTIFVLATTEFHKIPITIQSRCQKLNFRLLSNIEIIKQLKFICDSEKIKISDNSLSLIAKNAEGSMRDAISLLDQIFSFKGKEIEDKDVLMILGSTNLDNLFDLFFAFLDHNITEVIKCLDKILIEANVFQINKELIRLLQNLFYLKFSVIEVINLDEANINKLKVLSENLSSNQVSILLEEFFKLDQELKYFSDPDLLFRTKLLLMMEQGIRQKAKGTSADQENLSGIERGLPLSKSSGVEGDKVPFEKNLGLKGQSADQENLSEIERCLPLSKSSGVKGDKVPFEKNLGLKGQSADQENLSGIERCLPLSKSSGVKGDEVPFEKNLGVQGAKPLENNISPLTSGEDTGNKAFSWDKVLHIIKENKPSLYNLVLRDSILDKLENNRLFINIKDYTEFSKNYVFNNKKFIEEVILKEFNVQYDFQISATKEKNNEKFEIKNEVDTNNIIEKKEEIEKKKFNEIVALFEGSVL